jgi:hypothetical protein
LQENPSAFASYLQLDLGHLEFKAVAFLSTASINPNQVSPMKRKHIFIEERARKMTQAAFTAMHRCHTPLCLLLGRSKLHNEHNFHCNPMNGNPMSRGSGGHASVEKS